MILNIARSYKTIKSPYDDHISQTENIIEASQKITEEHVN